MDELDPELCGGFFSFYSGGFAAGEKRHVDAGDPVSGAECEDGGDCGIDPAAERHQDAGAWL
jgi:hypothetical protein